jgi:YidC/Oxa1 family membrane protein insertase
VENKNVFIAIALSMSVLLFWSAFVDSPKSIEKQNQKISSSQIENKIIDNGIVPNIDGTIVEKNISREDSLKKTSRVLLENNKIKGSISLEGAVIDDLSFKNYKVDIKSNNIVQFLSPKETKNGYFAETGWASIGNKTKVPSSKSIWSVAGNKILSVSSPVTLEWKNDSNLIFRKTIEIDDNYLFKINQEVVNNSTRRFYRRFR